MVARAASGDAMAVDGPVEEGIRGLPGNGSPLPSAVQSSMESRVGLTSTPCAFTPTATLVTWHVR